MSFPSLFPHLAQEHLVASFFRRSHGNWRSERRYYTLNNGETQEVVSLLSVEFLELHHPHLIELAQAHNLPAESPLSCGVLTTWNSNYKGPGSKQISGSTVFGVLGSILYRDRGFATSSPVTADFLLPEPNTLRLRTVYNNSTFEEEIKLVGSNFRTRQTIISKADEEMMIGQYFEQRLP
ncbi:MAG: phycobiliprotein lyase [Kovacikia sp.]